MNFRSDYTSGPSFAILEILLNDFMKKTFVMAICGIMVLAGFSCQRQAKPEQQEVFRQEVYYYLQVNRESSQFQKELIPANSKILSCGEYLTMRKGDSIAAVTKAELLRSALVQEFSVSPAADDFYKNPLIENSNITLNGIEDQNGKLIAKISGSFDSQGGCADMATKGMIQETVRQYANDNYQILLNGSEAEWRCLFDKSGTCK